MSFAGRPVASSDDLGAAIQQRQPGQRVSVDVVKTDGTRHTLSVTLGVRPVPGG